jgi:hypothetical protein
MVADAATVTNFSFETPIEATSEYQPAGAGWSFSVNAGIAAYDQPGFAPWFNTTPPDGNQAAFCQTSPGAGGDVCTISQTVTGFEIGDAYYIDYFTAERPGAFGGGVSVDVNLGGVDLGSYTPTTTAFTEVQTSAMTATATSMTLTFTGTGPGGGADRSVALDDVQANEAPEPGSALLLLAPAGWLAWRRRRVA